MGGPWRDPAPRMIPQPPILPKTPERPPWWVTALTLGGVVASLLAALWILVDLVRLFLERA